MNKIKLKSSKNNMDFLNVDTETHSLNAYIREVNKVAVLSREEEDRLAKLMSEGNLDARNQLVSANLRFVVSIAKNYLNKGVPFLDLINEGNMGLILACDKFDYKKGYRFISYAVWWIRQYITKAFAEQVGLIRLPMNRALQHFRIKNMIQKNSESDNNTANYSEIANKLNIKESEVNLLMKVTKRHVSIDTLIQNDKSEKRNTTIGDMLVDSKAQLPEDEFLQNQLKENINKTLKILSEKEQSIITFRFGLNGTKALSLSEIGQKFNVTKERIRQIEKRAINKLKQHCTNTNLMVFMKK